MKKFLLLYILSLPFFGWTQSQQELKLGMIFGSSYALNYEYIPPNKHSIFVNLNILTQPQSLSRKDSIAGQLLDLGELAFREPYLGIRLGRMVYQETDTISGWAWGYYLSTRFQLAQNRDFVREFNKKFGINPQTRSYYGAVGATIQYRWFIKENWSIIFLGFADFGLEKTFIDHFTPSSRVNTNPPSFLLEMTPVLFVGYRF
ncbi:MAG: hypothetical protein AAGG68_10875 [Bacteroidota bacterium]